ncbi:propionate CoA-transferase [Sulfitobacter mediterraneus]|uniref:acyl CoA:acetate/3-ketoacid CoA transferase n=1 Tax=Sulfitobacter TaxID=60136 RepID=UPI00193427B8|nr:MULTISPECIES: CoA-transferase [Sulfitobacter]MBM1633993.1 propionate CoA-transferase [Sulfitobacter mediterraneus]MBM1641491.1 propionate CoA-transferase [Sulfitobacter mediterraneus]MBM1645858.1 propionate CoA-transferase [Sulfitobacter mediterraneus]MBM1649611.1 propionate CoA-transferase [Sulfitobacter mediterraneus]MBM1653927.1 propionate CoA-transferase [Sulfitobacter mediterraneus]
MNKIVTEAQAVADIPSHATVASAGVIGWVTPDKVLKALGDRFAQTAAPRDLTFFFPCGTGDAVGIKGMDHVAREGLMKRIVSGSYINPVDPATGQRPALMRLIHDNKVEAYSWPIGATMHWLREVARKSPGYMTRVGLGTYADPRHGGGKFTDKATEDLIRVITLDDEELLFYPSWPIDVAILRAATADEHGNLSWEDEPLTTSNVALALAAKASGGKVIAQVRRVVPVGDRPASQNRLPGVFVDQVVVDPDMMMTTDVPYDAAYFGGEHKDISTLSAPPFSVDRIIANRIAPEVRKHELSIFGFGAATDVPLVMAENGQFDNGGIYDYPGTTEHGAYGGIVMPGWQFSANINPDALLDGVTQFDVIDGGLCKFTALSFAEYDASGVVNVSKFGKANPGAGGFIDIAQNAERLIFAGTFTTGGLRADVVAGKLVIEREGKVRKFVKEAASITYRVQHGVSERNQDALIVTERAVFRCAADGLELIEIAPGIDLQTQVLDLMDFAPVRIAEPLALMDAAHFLKPDREEERVST